MKIPELQKNFSEYNPEAWIGYEMASDYLYAINVFLNEEIDIGGIIGETCHMEISDSELIEVLKKEITFVGYEIDEIHENDIVHENEMKICLIRDERTGYYHFLRRDKDGSWSEKYSMELPEKVNWEEDEFYYQDFRKRWYFKIRISKC